MKQSKIHPRIILTSLVALLLIAPSPPTLLTLSDQGFITIFPASSGIIPISSQPTDLDGDGRNEKLLYLEGHLKISNQGLIVWESPQAWKITQVEITDLNRDSIPEVALLVWREFSPWPIDTYIPHPGRIKDFHNQENVSCHLILIGFHQGSYQEIWAGSALVDPLLSFTTGDLNGDGFQELIALESRYDAHLFEGSTLTIWEWNGFGFTLITRGATGYYSSLRTVRSLSGQDLLLVQGILWR